MKRRIFFTLVTAILLIFASVFTSYAAQDPTTSASSSESVPVSVHDPYLRVQANVRGADEGMICFYDETTGKTGYLDMQGNPVIPCDFHYGSSFSEGLAYVDLTQGAGGYIDYSGRFILPPVYSFGSDFRDGKAIVYMHDNTCLIIDTNGESLLDTEFKSIRYDQTVSRYMAVTDENETLILTDDLDIEKTFPFEISYFQTADDTVFAVFFQEDYTMTGLCDYDTGKVIFEATDYAYVGFVNGFITVTSEEKQWVKIYDSEGTLLETFEDTSYVYPLSDDSFIYFDIMNEKNILRQNGMEKEIDYGVYQALFSDLLIVYSSEPGENSAFGVINSKGEVVLPLEFDSICPVYYDNYLNPEKKSSVFMALSGDVCTVYDSDCKPLDVYENVSHIGNGFIGYEDGFSLILDENADEIAVLQTDGAHLSGSYDSLLLCSDENMQITYIYLPGISGERGEYSYEPVKAVDPGKSSEKSHTSYFTVGGVKRSIDGIISLQEDWIPAPVVIGGRTMICPVYLDSLFDPIGAYAGSQSCEAYSGSKAMNLEFDEPSALLTYFDFENGVPVHSVVSLDAPALHLPSSAVFSEFDMYHEEDLAYVPLRAVAESLGHYVYWNDGLVGISDSPFTLSEQEAADIKASLTDNMFTPAEFKRLDASLATQPYADALVKKTLAVEDIYYNVPNYTNTIPGYEALINGEKDIILVTEPSEEILRLAESKGVELEITPFAKEGFVFLLNASNPVDTLSVQQLKDIYSGKITNWEEVGGPDSPIIAYQRNESSGSQTIMENVFMKGEDLMEPITERRIMSMAGLIDVIAEFEGDVNNSIGYSVYYYATQMYSNEMVKLVKVDGIAPDPATIEDGTYPIIVNYYIVTRKGESSQFVKDLSDYILSTDGQTLLKEVGLVPVM